MRTSTVAYIKLSLIYSTSLIFTNKGFEYLERKSNLGKSPYLYKNIPATIIVINNPYITIIQGGKAEGLFSNAQANVLGSQRANALSKATSFLSTIFVIGALLISVAISGQKTVFDNVTTNEANNNQVNTPINNDITTTTTSN